MCYSEYYFYIFIYVSRFDQMVIKFIDTLHFTPRRKQFNSLCSTIENMIFILFDSEFSYMYINLVSVRLLAYISCSMCMGEPFSIELNKPNETHVVFIEMIVIAMIVFVKQT